jgi:hypothetical protein
MAHADASVAKLLLNDAVVSVNMAKSKLDFLWEHADHLAEKQK